MAYYLRQIEVPGKNVLYLKLVNQQIQAPAIFTGLHKNSHDKRLNLWQHNP